MPTLNKRRSMKHLVQSCAPRSGRSRMSNNARTSSTRYEETSFDSFFFPGGTGVKSAGHSGWRLAQARQVHRDVCSLLSSAAEWLQNTIRRFSSLLPTAADDAAAAAAATTTTTTTTSGKKEPESEQQQQARLAILEQVLNSVEREEDFLIAANSEIGQLCAQNVLLWRQLLERFAGSEPVRILLAQQHHTYRVRRFAEAFYVVDHPRQAMANCNDADVHTYLYISDALRKS